LLCGLSLVLCLIVSGLWIATAAGGGWQGMSTRHQAAPPPEVRWYEFVADARQIQVMRIEPSALDWWGSSRALMVGDWNPSRPTKNGSA
jgi:hypothetical protein